MQNDTFRDIVACPTWEMTLTRGDKTGTSTIVNCAYIGVILSVSKSAKRVQVQRAETLEGSNP